MALLRAGKERSAESLFTIASTIDTPDNRSFGMRSLAYLEMYRGRYRESVPLLEQAATITESERSLLSAARNRWLLASAYLDLGDLTQARQQLDRSESILGSLAVSPAYLYYLASLRLRTGDVTGARRLQRRLEASAHSQRPEERSPVALLRGMLLLYEGRPDSAIAEVRKCSGYTWFPFRDDILSQAYEGLARPDSALASAQRLDSTWSFGYEAQRLWRHGSLRVARLALRSGDTVLARAAGGRQLQRWERGDADLPDLLRAKALVGRLDAR